MKGLIRYTLAGSLLAGAVAALSGCQTSYQDRYYRFVDPCWPQRYSAQARASVNEAFAAQVANGHALVQTVWNYHFEEGTDKLTPGGMDYLAHLARVRPAPDPHIFLETAYDLPYDPARPHLFVKARTDLNQRRIVAVQKYLDAITADRPVPWQITLHDPGERGLSAPAMLQSIQQRDTNFRGTMPIAVGGVGTVGQAAGR